MKRSETDYIGQRQVPVSAHYGIHSLRAMENFPVSIPFHIEWYRALGMVKHACYLSVSKMYVALLKEGLMHRIENPIEPSKLNALIEASKEVWQGEHFENFIVPAIQGGAGTSINMNINEIIANVALSKLKLPLGSYSEIDPIETANVYQSTNDVVPTSLKVAAMQMLNQLETEINSLRSKVEMLEKAHRGHVRLAYTQMQAAVPSTWGQLFSTYSDMLARDWWRVSKCFERIKVVNIGGGAIGTGLGTPRFFIMDVVGQLQQISGFPITRSENLNDATANLDTLVEVHATIKSLAVNIEKLSSDLRLLGSDLAGNHIKLPAKQVGSSLMPGIINPVICEYAITVAHKVYSNDMLVSNLCGQGCLDLNAYLPTIGHALLESIKLLVGVCQTLGANLLDGLQVNIESAERNVYQNPAITTALLPEIGFNKCTEMANLMRSNGCDVFEANKVLKMLSSNRIELILSAENLIRLGFSFKY